MKLGYIYAGKVKGTLELGADPYVAVGLWNAGHFIFPGRIVSVALAGDVYIELPANYLWGELIEVWVQVTSWAGIGNEFRSLYIKSSAALTNALGYLAGVTFISRVEEAIDLYAIRGVIVEVSLKAGGQTVEWVRGAEVCIDSSTPVDPTVNITHYRVLQIETQLQSDIAPTGENVGLWFEWDSAAGASLTNWHDIRLAAGPVIFAGHAAQPVGANEPFSSAPIGSLYLTTAPADENHVVWSKHADTDNDTDWGFHTATSL